MMFTSLALLALQTSPRPSVRMVAPGPLPRAQAQAMVAKRFAVMDADNSGAIDLAEAERAAAAAAADKVANPGRRVVSDIPGSGTDTAWFAATDVDRDAKVTLAELSVAPLANFDRLDTDRDGILSSEERSRDAELRRAPLGS